MVWTWRLVKGTGGYLWLDTIEGDVPPYYREVYEAICCKQEDKVQGSVFHKLLNRTKLSSVTQNQIAELVESSKVEPLSKSALYKGLLLIALAQQGKQPSAKLLENIMQEYPKPQLGDVSELESLRMQARGNPILLSWTLQDLLHIDMVQVELIPEKKGLFLKHVEYEVSSQRFKSTVYRRYNDFVVFHEVLLQRFPYRMVPTLPPKRMLRADREFIESRRRALKRFVNLVARHPFFSKDEILQIFLCFNGPELLPPDIQAQFGASRELIRNIYNSFRKLRDRAERMAFRSAENASDLLLFGKELSTLGSDTTPVPSWASATSGMWGILKQTLKSLSVEFALLADKAARQGQREEEEVVEKLNIFLDLLQSYKDLCERHEKGVLHEHQRALQKYTSMKRQMMSVTVQSKEQITVEQLESRIMQQENTILTMELRNYFSLFCLHQETQLIHIYLHITSHVLTAFIDSQIQGHHEMSEVWKDLKPKLGGLLPNGMPSSP
ncbi:sorting nexin-8a isoform X3 [Narcine bancroftii]|uniref:sorting nexin-8a isoform X3 n=1 Tax=Narcine bancroftii TaxID=1343680 RepID=UPI003831B1EC